MNGANMKQTDFNVRLKRRSDMRDDLELCMDQPLRRGAARLQARNQAMQTV